MVEPSRSYLLFYTLLLQLVASAISGVGFAVSGNGYWLFGLFLWVAWFVSMFFAVSPRAEGFVQNHRVGVKRGAIGIFFGLFLMGIVEIVVIALVVPSLERSGVENEFMTLMEQMKHSFEYNDGTALGQQSAENLLQGKNPYASSNVVTAMIKYHGSYDRVTPLRLGPFEDSFPYPSQEELRLVWDRGVLQPEIPPPEIESQVCYPAGSFLLPAPFIAAGVTDIRIIYVIFVVAGLAYAIWRIPAGKRWLFLAFAIVSLELWNSLSDGETGSIVFPLLLIAWISIGKNNWLSAIAMGLAVSTKQTAWFFLPFYLILLWRTSGTRSLLRTCTVVVSVFVLLNAYFFALDPALWATSVLSPVTEPMFPLGVGLVSLVMGSGIDIRSSLPFSLMEAVAMVGCILWYFRYSRHYPYAGPLLAVLPLFFAWRSLWSYFFYVQLITLACLLVKTDFGAGQHDGNNSSHVVPQALTGLSEEA